MRLALLHAGMQSGRAHGVHRCRAYAPGLFKVLTSSDGVNFREASAWRGPAQDEAAFVETVMFTAPISAKAVSLVMHTPLGWRYFGVNVVAPLIEPATFLLAGTAAAPSGETCIVATGAGAQAEDCLAAIAAGDGREVFAFSGDGQVRSAATGKCIVIADGDMASGGRVALEDCRAAQDAGDGRSAWELAVGGRLRASHMGGHCVGFAGGNTAALTDCTGDGAEHVLGGDPVAVVAVPEFDAGVAAAARDAATLLAAAATRQAHLLAQLRRAVPASGACKLAAVSVNGTQGGMTRAMLGRKAGMEVSSGGEAATQAVAKICTALGVDMQAVHGVIAESALSMGALRDQLAQL